MFIFMSPKNSVVFVESLTQRSFLLRRKKKEESENQVALGVLGGVRLLLFLLKYVVLVAVVHQLSLYHTMTGITWQPP